MGKIEKGILVLKQKIKAKLKKLCNVFKIQQKAKANIKVFSLVFEGAQSWGKS